MPRTQTRNEYGTEDNNMNDEYDREVSNRGNPGRESGQLTRFYCPIITYVFILITSLSRHIQRVDVTGLSFQFISNIQRSTSPPPPSPPLSRLVYSDKTTKVARQHFCLKAFPMHDGRSTLIILLLTNPHPLERRKTR